MSTKPYEKKVAGHNIYVSVPQKSSRIPPAYSKNPKRNEIANILRKAPKN